MSWKSADLCRRTAKNDPRVTLPEKKRRPGIETEAYSVRDLRRRKPTARSVIHDWREEQFEQKNGESGARWSRPRLVTVENVWYGGIVRNQKVASEAAGTVPVATF